MATKAVVGLDIMTGAFVNNLKKPMTAWGKFKASIFSVKSALGGIFAGVAVQQMLSVGKEVIDAARGAYAAEAQLAQAMKQKGRYTEEAAQKLLDYADKQMFVTGVEHEEITQAQRLLIQYGLWGNELQRATELSLDMAASGKSLLGSAEVLGRAYVGNTATLAKYGASMEQVRKAGGGFGGALKVLEGLFKGQAEALANTDIGRLNRMTMIWGEFKENVGIGLVEAITGVSASLGLTDANLTRVGTTMGKIVASGAESFFYDVAAGVTALKGAMEGLIGVTKLLSPLYYTKRIIAGESLFGGIGENIEGAKEAMALSKEFTGKSDIATQRRYAAEIKAAAYARGVEDGVDMQQKELSRNVKNMARTGR